MFRRGSSVPLDAELVKALYRGVLGREPAPPEVEGLQRALSNAGSVEHALKDMLSSHEFGVMVLPNLINSYVGRVPDNPVFFLHVPKTAGTAFRRALTDTMGIPAFQLYVHSTWQGFGRDATMRFWPLWAGHAGVASFPQTHRGITVFREARSRVLSSFRQQERELVTGDPNGPKNTRFTNFNPQPEGNFSVSDGFSKWVRGARDTVGWFIDTPHVDGAFLWNGQPSGEFRASLSRAELRLSLSRSLSRFDAAAWVHDSGAMIRAIGQITGVESVVPLGHENQYRPLSDGESIRLTSDDLAELNRTADSEKVLIDIAVDLGLIPPLDPDFADAEFERTAKRLNFVLP